MKFGKVIEQPRWSFPEVELSDPPIYSVDRRSVSSKDGMLWVPVAPHAAVGAAPNGTFGFAATTCSSHFTGAAPAPGPYVTITVGGSPSK